MPRNTEHRLEESHHAAHASHDDFNKRIAVSMAIIAAALAAVTLLSHRAHNDTLRHQNDALRSQADQQAKVLQEKNEIIGLQAKSSVLRTKEADLWAFYQAKKNRMYLHEVGSELLLANSRDANKGEPSDEAKKLAADWKSKVVKFDGDTKQIEQDARKLQEQAIKLEEEIQQRQSPSLYSSEHKEAEGGPHEAHDPKEVELHESHLEHEKAVRFDAGELGIELALVLCSISVLTKRWLFWVGGIAIGALGFLVAISAYVPFLMG